MPNLSTLQALGIVTQFGVVCALAVGLGYLLGSWLDSRLGTGLVFTLIGAVGGMISAVSSTLQLMNYVKRRAATRDARGRE